MPIKGDAMPNEEKVQYVIAIDGREITPTPIEGRTRADYTDEPLIALFGRWYEAWRLTIEEEIP